MKQISVEALVKQVNRSAFRKSSIPMELSSGWPCIHKMGGTLCMTVPYYLSAREKDRVALYSIRCSVTVAVANPERIMDFTLYSHHIDWLDVDFDHPVGYFRHKAIADVPYSEYIKMRQRLYGYYDALIASVFAGIPYTPDREMTELFGKLMEPSLYEQYLKINKPFYSRFCRLE